MQLKPCVKLWSKQGLCQMLLVALCYAFFLSMTKWTTVVLPYLEIRFATFVPVVGGLMFGLPGAVGAALGNFLSGLGGDTVLPMRCFSSVDNFILAYVPYHLWYLWQGAKAPLFIHDQLSFGRYIKVVFWAALLTSALLSVQMNIFYPGAMADSVSFLVFMGNNFTYPILIGMPLLLLLQKKHCTFYYPVDYEPEEAVAADFIPLAAEISSRLLTFTAVLLVLGCILFMLFDEDAFVGNAALAVKNWFAFYLQLLIVLLCVFRAIYVFLGKLEQEVTRPLAMLSNQAASFVETGKLSKTRVAEPYREGMTEMDVLKAAFAKMSVDVHQYFQKLTAAKEQEHAVRAQLAVATQIQQGTLPNLEQLNAWLKEHSFSYHLEGGMQAASNVGGDMFDCFALGAKELFLCIGDVSGKGIPASLFSVLTQTLLDNTARNLAKSSTDIAEIVAHTNNSLVEQNQEVFFVTLWAGILNLETGVLCYVNAGHNPPLVYDSESKQTTWVTELSGPVLGLMPGAEYTARELVLPQHGRLLLYTDGFNEAENAQQAFFGNERLEASFAACQNGQELLENVQAFVNGAAASDDKTFVWLTRG